MKIPEIKECKCGVTPELTQWNDTRRPNASFITCDCGLMTKSYYSKNPDLAKKRCITDWNKKFKGKRKIVQDGLKNCEKCGSEKVSLVDFKQIGLNNHSFMAVCENCVLMTDEMKPDGSLRTKKETIDLWNA
jgi:hypothetical protein